MAGGRLAMTGDRDLLEALFAQQLGFAPASAIMAAGAEWLIQRERGLSLRDVLVSRGVLDAERARLVDALVDEAIAQHGGSAEQTLRSLPPQAQASLSQLSESLGTGATLTPSRETPDPSQALSFDSLDTPENICTEARGRYSFNTGRKGRTEELGRGGAGRVVVARDHFLGRDVAMKELLRDVTQSPRYDTLHVRGLEARFLREARVTGQLEHPAIVPVYELGRRRDGTLYYTMRRVRGRTLAQALADTSSLEGRLAFLPDLLTACRAVAAAHHRAVVHRDLKPQNVMLGPHGETYVMDWGLARVMGRADRHAATVQLAPDITAGRDLGPIGTPSYMSPEQASGNRDDIDERSDVWGLGAMLFELLTGRAPYVGRSPWDVLAEVRSGPPPRVRTLEPAVPPELAAICDKALAWNREHRYRDAAAMAADLDAWLGGRRVTAYPYSVREVGRRLLRRHRGLASVVAVTLVALLALGATVAVRAGQERDEARSMARFFLSDVAPTLANVPGTAELLDQLSRNALEAFAAGVDPQRGARDDRLLLARAWNEVAHQQWRLGLRDASRQALASGRRYLAPLVEAFPVDVEVQAAAVEAETWEVDLLIDEGRRDEALRGLDALQGRAKALAAMGPATAASLRAQYFVFDRSTFLTQQLGQFERSLPLAQQTREVALAWYRLAPDSPDAAPSVSDSLGALASSYLALGREREALDALRAGVQQAERLRTVSDTRAMKESHAQSLAALAKALDPRTDGAERSAAIRDARRLLAEVQRADPDKNIILSELAMLALLDGDAEAAWGWAERIENLGFGAEFDEAVIAAAFATGRDALVREKAADPKVGAPVAAMVWAGLLEALDGNVTLARETLGRCGALDCGRHLTWLPDVLARRLDGRPGPAAAALRRLVQAEGRARSDGARLNAALAALVAELEGQR